VSIDTVEEGQTITKLVFTVSGMRDGAHEKIIIDGNVLTLEASTGTLAGNGIDYNISMLPVPPVPGQAMTATVVLTMQNG
jgi:hypothetical protein